MAKPKAKDPAQIAQEALELAYGLRIGTIKAKDVPPEMRVHVDAVGERSLMKHAITKQTAKRFDRFNRQPAYR